MWGTAAGLVCVFCLVRCSILLRYYDSLCLSGCHGGCLAAAPLMRLLSLARGMLWSYAKFLLVLPCLSTSCTYWWCSTTLLSQRLFIRLVQGYCRCCLCSLSCTLSAFASDCGRKAPLVATGCVYSSFGPCKWSVLLSCRLSAFASDMAVV